MFLLPDSRLTVRYLLWIISFPGPYRLFQLKKPERSTGAPSFRHQYTHNIRFTRSPGCARLNNPVRLSLNDASPGGKLFFSGSTMKNSLRGYEATGAVAINRRPVYIFAASVARVANEKNFRPTHHRAFPNDSGSRLRKSAILQR